MQFIFMSKYALTIEDVYKKKKKKVFLTMYNCFSMMNIYFRRLKSMKSNITGVSE